MKRSKVRYDLVLLIIVIVISFAFIKHGLDRYDSLRAQENRLAKDISSGEARKKAILSRLKELEDDRHVEMLARRRLGYVKSGEIAYKVITKE